LLLLVNLLVVVSVLIVRDGEEERAGVEGKDAVIVAALSADHLIEGCAEQATKAGRIDDRSQACVRARSRILFVAGREPGDVANRRLRELRKLLSHFFLKMRVDEFMHVFGWGRATIAGVRGPRGRRQHEETSD
jgi:hypothetical protein